MTISPESGFSGTIDEIAGMLDKEIASADEILALLEEELQALLMMDMSALVSLSKKKMNQLQRMEKLDAAVQEKISAILLHAGKKRERVPSRVGEKIVDISSVANLLEETERDRLRQKKDRLQLRRRAIADKNYINKKLVEDSLGYLNDAISLLTTRPEEPGYSKKKSGKKTSMPAFLSRAV